jgi:hypothetical protein
MLAFDPVDASLAISNKCTAANVSPYPSDVINLHNPLHLQNISIARPIAIHQSSIVRSTIAKGLAFFGGSSTISSSSCSSTGLFLLLPATLPDSCPVVLSS